MENRTKRFFRIIIVVILLSFLAPFSERNVIATIKNTDESAKSYSSSSQLIHNTSSHRGNSTSRKPIFMLHIGPSKSETTSLQCLLGSQQSTLMNKDNIYFMGDWHSQPECRLLSTKKKQYFMEESKNSSRPSLLMCFDDDNDDNYDEHQSCEHINTKWDEFANVIQEHYELGHNVIMSDAMFFQNFGRTEVQQLARILLPKWRVRIVYTYQHHFVAIQNIYQQEQDPYVRIGMPHYTKKQIWPSDGGYKIDTFRNWKKAIAAIESTLQKFPYWVNAFNDVLVFDINMATLDNNNNNNNRSDFLCNVMPEAKSSCNDDTNVSRENITESSSSSSSSPASHITLRYDMLAVQAMEQGLLNHTNMNRTSVREAVQLHCESKGWTKLDDFPLDCMTQDELEGMLNDSLKYGEYMKPHLFNHHKQEFDIESEIRSEFVKFQNDNMFCSVNARRTLEEVHWQRFFRNLKDD